ncbi:hypothetical protein [Brucella pituitosa]|uniref:hypothetical protein n=1 Tax=Brucella pituitosa TaxID=571256 RepID=UPI003F4ACD6F
MTLIDRLSKLDGPRYVMDVAIALETDFWPKDRIKSVVYNDNGDPTVWFTDGPDMPLPPAYTSSVDAAIALSERMLPGWKWYAGNWNVHAAVLSTDRNSDQRAVAATPAIALCIAVLKGHATLLRAKEASHGE